MSIIKALNTLFAARQVSIDPGERQHYGMDRTRIVQPNPLAVVWVEQTAQVQTLVKLALEYGIGLVPSGGRTGLSGGAAAGNQEIVVSFERMNKILEFNHVDQSIRCQAGVITADIQRKATENNLMYPVDFASAGSSQIGGNIATNAGGIKVIRYGMTRNWVSGLTVVSGQGEILDLNNGLCKNATGYDLRHLFIGSEGTLGLITEATLQLCPPPRALKVLFAAIETLEQLMQVFLALRKAIDAEAIELLTHRCVELVQQHSQIQSPFEKAAPYYLLVEFDADDPRRESAVMQVLEQAIDEGWVLDAVLSQNQKQAKNLWALRENISEAVHTHTPYKNDLAVRVRDIAEFMQRLEQLISQRYQAFEVVIYGHIGDGNLHLNVLKPNKLDTQTFFQRCKAVNTDIFALLRELNGSVSAEHGVGLLKREDLHYSRSAAEIAYMRSIKASFDPANILNPGKLLPALE